MSKKAIGGGVYRDEAGGYWARPWINRRRTWRKLKAVAERAAIREAATTNFTTTEGLFPELSVQYLKSGCPNRRLEERPEPFCAIEKSRLKFLDLYFAKFRPEEIKMPLVISYKTWRIRRIKKGKDKPGAGDRTVDLDLNTLSNVLNYGVGIGRLEINYIRAGRPRFRRANQVRHCRVMAPVDGGEIHKVAAHFLDDRRKEVFAWLGFFHAMTGCRTSELLRLRTDARTADDPGFISGNQLFLGRRSKHGINPFVLITDDLADMLRCFHHWHAERYPTTHWFFPGRNYAEGTKVKARENLTPTAFNHALREAAEKLKTPRRTPHGYRSLYVTKRRGDDIPDVQIAAEIGDKTVDLIRTTYGDRPANWVGGNRITFLPGEGLPAWRIWDRPERKIINL